jgi:hypothetical protein
VVRNQQKAIFACYTHSTNKTTKTMSPVVKNVIAVIAGLALGSIVNMSLISIGHNVFPIEGLDPNDMESLAAIMPNLEMKYFVFPFMAHALGTFVGAILAGLIAATHKMKFAIGVGVAFLIGGVIASSMIPAPKWFVFADLTFAYLPFAWLAGKITSRGRS